MSTYVGQQTVTHSDLPRFTESFHERDAHVNLHVSWCFPLLLGFVISFTFVMKI